ncbi:unnamed protein product [Sympodiomycopsis kandeliae]
MSPHATTTSPRPVKSSLKRTTQLRANLKRVQFEQGVKSFDGGPRPVSLKRQAIQAIVDRRIPAVTLPVTETDLDKKIQSVQNDCLDSLRRAFFYALLAKNHEKKEEQDDDDDDTVSKAGQKDGDGDTIMTEEQDDDDDDTVSKAEQKDDDGDTIMTEEQDDDDATVLTEEQYEDEDTVLKFVQKARVITAINDEGSKCKPTAINELLKMKMVAASMLTDTKWCYKKLLREKRLEQARKRRRDELNDRLLLL